MERENNKNTKYKDSHGSEILGAIIFTIVLILLMWGASVVYIDKPPTASVLLPILKQIRPTIMLTVPLIIEKIYKHKILPQFTNNRLMRLISSR